MIARWLRIVRPIPYTLDGPGGTPIKGTMLPASDYGSDGKVGESYVTMAVGCAGVAALLAAGDLIDLGTTYDAPPAEGVFYRFRWPDQT